jgi:hypothetical protein
MPVLLFFREYFVLSGTEEPLRRCAYSSLSRRTAFGSLGMVFGLFFILQGWLGSGGYGAAPKIAQAKLYWKEK